MLFWSSSIRLFLRPVNAAVVTELEDTAATLKGNQATYADLYVKIAKKVGRNFTGCSAWSMTIESSVYRYHATTPTRCTCTCMFTPSFRGMCTHMLCWIVVLTFLQVVDKGVEYIQTEQRRLTEEY